MKKFFSMLAIAVMVMSFVACDDDDKDPVKDEVDNEVISGVITTDQNWTADRIYELNGRVIVNAGATLTIEAGTIIKGQEGTGTNAAVLMIARGGKINAIGTADKPIIMTTILDNIEVGETAGTNLDENDKGKWGGLVILGKAPISVSGATEAQIEGVPAAETLGLYGGDVANDNSGTVRFVSIRHGGTSIAEGSEINGLTLGGVGSGTTISDVEILANEDDGIEFFGGTVNVKNILVTYQGDDAVDIDQAYSGTVDGFMVVHGGSTDKGLEIDGPEGAANATGKFLLKNGTLIGEGSDLADFKSRAQGTVENIVFKGYNTGRAIKIAASYATGCTPGSTNAFSNLIAGDLVFTNIKLDGEYVIDVYSASTDNCAEANIPEEDQAAAEEKIAMGAATGGPALSAWNWTMSAELALLD